MLVSPSAPSVVVRESPTVARRPPGGDPASLDSDLIRTKAVAILRHLAATIETGDAQAFGAPEDGVLLDTVVGGVRCLLQLDRRPQTEALSPREGQVAAMIAEGRTNQAIASALDISLWTVSTHVRRIFAKLGVGSRAEMVAHIYGRHVGRSALPS